ncbi:MAG: hypothetical protein ACI86H_002481 [bacterium]|jgi:hypothetical protein
MNVKFLVEPFDRLIEQAKEYIQEQDQKKKYIRQIEEKVESIRPELEQRKIEIEGLLAQINDFENQDKDNHIRQELEESLEQIESYLRNIELIAEKEIASDILSHESTFSEKEFRERKERYVNTEVLRLEEELDGIDNFFEVADFTNQIWADFNLFEEFHRDEIVVQMLVNRMNQTNTKNTETRMGKDLRRTLEHIRNNLIKTSAWSDEEIIEYQDERDKKIRRPKQINIPLERKYHVCVVGSAPQMITQLLEEYDVPENLHLEWLDVATKDFSTKIKSAKKDLVLLITIFGDHQIHKQLRTELEAESVPYNQTSVFTKKKVVKLLEDELIQITFRKQYS